MFKLIVAFCTYNRADRLPDLVTALRAQDCSQPFEILAVNNSKDNTLTVLEQLARESGANLRYVTETQQGLAPARNRALTEAIDSNILVFLDNDEMPQADFLQAACDAPIRYRSNMATEQALC